MSISVITIDGPSGAGKGAVSARVARRLEWHVLDSGAVYRAVALAAIERGIEGEDEDGLVALCHRVPLTFEPAEDGIGVFLDGAPVDDRIRTEAVSAMASRVAANPRVREALLALQRAYARAPGLVADGRDMGTVVFPEAPIKVFLEASVAERARRRYNQLKEKEENVTFSRLFQDLEARDRRDRERAVSPTLAAADAETIDSTEMSLDEVVDQVVSLARSRLGANSE